jgi:hypothetical protein
MVFFIVSLNLILVGNESKILGRIIPHRSPIADSWEKFDTFFVFEKRHGKVINEEDKVADE